MRQFRLWGASAALACGLGGPAVAGDSAPVQQTTLMHKLFGPRAPKPAGPAAASPDRPPTITAPLAPEVLADALRAEQDAYLRRVSVCTELRRVAVEKGDDALARQADELERQASSLYNLRVTGLGVSPRRSALPEPAKGLDVAARGAPGTAATQARRLDPQAAPVPGSTTAQVREVKP
ncbi:unnamed protein product [Gemmataceae bacterium]|jgi:hypothetical protein|nr:unnamed protein product [Gemmataceae bacterium]VTU00290.1 unnamed protein product [Gemmataceae bacterium]